MAGVSDWDGTEDGIYNAEEATGQPCRGSWLSWPSSSSSSFFTYTGGDRTVRDYSYDGDGGPYNGPTFLGGNLTASPQTYGAAAPTYVAGYGSYFEDAESRIPGLALDPEVRDGLWRHFTAPALPPPHHPWQETPYPAAAADSGGGDGMTTTSGPALRFPSQIFQPQGGSAVGPGSGSGSGGGSSIPVPDQPGPEEKGREKEKDKRVREQQWRSTAWCRRCGNSLYDAEANVVIDTCACRKRKEKGKEKERRNRAEEEENKKKKNNNKKKRTRTG